MTRNILKALVSSAIAISGMGAIAFGVSIGNLGNASQAGNGSMSNNASAGSSSSQTSWPSPSYNYWNGYVGTDNNLYLDQEKATSALAANICTKANVSRNYYVSNDINNDGIKDMGANYFARDNFVMQGGTIPVYLIGGRQEGYNGTKVRYFLPQGGENMLKVLNGSSASTISSNIWYRQSKIAPKDVWVRAVESQSLLVSAPESNSITSRTFQIAYEIAYRPFQQKVAGTNNYWTYPVSSPSDGGPVYNTNRWYIYGTNWTQPVWQTNYVLNPTPAPSTSQIQWGTEARLAWECLNATVHWCGDGIVDNGTFDIGSASEQCDLGSANGQPGSLCSASCQNIPQPLPPDVTVMKSVTGSNIQGNNVTYTITYRNIGSGAANNVTVTDTLGSGLLFIPSSSMPSAASVVSNANGTTTITWNIGNMPAGSQGIIKFNAQIKQTVPNCTKVLNDVHVAASNETLTLNNDYHVEHPIQCPTGPQLWIQKDVVASTGGYMPNGYAIYTIKYGNSGSGTAINATVSDTLPSELTYVSAMPTPASVAGQALSWNVGNIAPGQQGIIKIFVKINATIPLCQNYIVNNTGTVMATNAGPVKDDANFLVLCYDLWSNKVIDKPVVASGDVVTYTIKYGNLGPITAPNWSLVDTLPTGLNYIINSTTVLSGVNIGQPVVTGNPTVGQTLTWTGFTNMPAGYSGLVQIKATVLGPVASGHVYVNKVCIAGDNNLNNNNCGEATTTTSGSGPFFDVNIKKSVSATVLDFGQHITYTIVVTNESDVLSPITGYTVNDYLPAGVDYVGNPTGPTGMTVTLTGNNKDITFGNLPPLAPGASITITFEAEYKSSQNETNYTEVCTYTGTSVGTGNRDRDSNPCNRGRNTSVEDDEDQVTVGPKGNGGQNPECQGLSASPDVSNLTTNQGSISVQYECRTTWGGYPVDAVLDCGNGQIFSGTTINNNPFKATCTYGNPTNTRAVCVVARRPNVNCELPVKIGPTGGGGHPYCGNGILNVGEMCDPGNAALGIPPVGVPAGKVCRPDCTYTDVPPGFNAKVKCSYIDPPAINVGEYMPYWWDMEYEYNRTVEAAGRATSFCSTREDDARIDTTSLQCEFILTGPNGQSQKWTKGCYTRTSYTLIDSALNAAKIRYDMNIFPGGLDAKQITGTYYMGLGEYKIEMKVISGRLCNGTQMSPANRVCQMNFGVTKQYGVSRSTRGTYSSTTDLPDYKRQDQSKVLQTSDLIKVLDPFTLNNADKNLITQMVNKYVNLAVKVDTIDDKLNNSTAKTVSKVPGKNIFVIDANHGSVTVSEKATYQGGAFTLIIINGDLTVKGNLTKNPNGMFIVRDGDMIFSSESDAKENNQDQLVKGIFIGLHNVIAQGDGQPAFNNDLNKPWINGGRLTIQGVLLGGDLQKMIVGRRSVVESWFDKKAADGLLDDGALVIKANPEVFTNLPPGAEDISLTLNVFKQ